MLNAAHCTTEVVCTFPSCRLYMLSLLRTLIRHFAVTTHHKHAWEIAKVIVPEKYDAVVTVSGDGLVYEVLNGFAEHADPMRALRIPIVPVPAGSGNALSLNLLGLQVRVSGYSR